MTSWIALIFRHISSRIALYFCGQRGVGGKERANDNHCPAPFCYFLFFPVLFSWPCLGLHIEGTGATGLDTSGIMSAARIRHECLPELGRMGRPEGLERLRCQYLYLSRHAAAAIAQLRHQVIHAGTKGRAACCCNKRSFDDHDLSTTRRSAVSSVSSPLPALQALPV